MNCDLTHGLCSLIYIHRVIFKPNNRIKGTRAYKYCHIIKKLIDKDFSPTTPTPLSSKAGFCYMTIKKSKPYYVYWNDVN